MQQAAWQAAVQTLAKRRELDPRQSNVRITRKGFEARLASAQAGATVSLGCAECRALSMRSIPRNVHGALSAAR
jgi:hypothetical protein